MPRMIDCPACRAAVSSQARSCPSCGQHLRESFAGCLLKGGCATATLVVVGGALLVANIFGFCR